MTQPKPPTQDTAPPEIRKLADDYLDYRWQFDNDFQALLDRVLEPNQGIPLDWAEALASELFAAINDRCAEWVETLIAGRPYDTPLVEWEARDLDKRPQDAAEMRAEMAS